MRIAFLVDEFPKVSETFILRQITGLIDRGHDVDIYAWRGEEIAHADVSTYHLLGHTTYHLPQRKLSRLLRLPIATGSVLQATSRGKHLRKHWRFGLGLNTFYPTFGPLYAAHSLINHPPYDVVHAHFGTNGILGLFLRDLGLLDVPILTTFHGVDVQVALPAVSEALRKWLFNSGDYFTVNSGFTSEAVQNLGAPTSRMEKLPVGLDVERYSFRIRKLTGQQPVHLLTIGRLVEKKGLEYAIRAVAKVTRTHPNILYTIIGEGEQRPMLERLIHNLGMKAHIHLVGRKTESEVKNSLDAAHLFILPSVTARNGDTEGQGLVLQEAQAVGLPVLATRHNGFPEGVLDGNSGFLVAERDSEALAERLQFLIDHPETWPEMGTEGRRFVEQNFDIKALNDRLVDMYMKIVEAFDAREPGHF